VTRILLISHEPEAAPALVGRILHDRGYEIDTHVVLADPAAPDTAFPDHGRAVIASAPSPAYDEVARAWVEPEIALIQEIVEQEVPYLGVCFGGQLLAESLGGHVERAPVDEQEIGLVTFDADDLLPVPAGPWFTWHEDRVVLPDSVDVLAHNGKAPQIFRFGRAVGTQFHPEADTGVVGAWVRLGPDHIPDHTSAAQLLQDLEIHEATLRRNCEQLVDWFMGEIAEVEA
jgi:GMP synthase-like glutamine amidotransferase